MAKNDDAERKRKESRAEYKRRLETRRNRREYTPFQTISLPDEFSADRGPKLKPREQRELERRRQLFERYARLDLYHPSEIVHNQHLREAGTFWGQFGRNMEGYQDGWEYDTSEWLAPNVGDLVPEGLRRQYVAFSAEHPERQWAGPRAGAWGDGTPRSQLPSHKIDRGMNRPTFHLQKVMHSPAHLGPFERWKPARVTADVIQAGRVVAAVGNFAKGRQGRMHTAGRPLVQWHLTEDHGLSDPKEVREARRACVDAWDKWMDWDGLAANLSAQGKQLRTAWQSEQSVEPDKKATQFGFMRKQLDRCYPYFVPTPHGAPMLLYTRPPAYIGFNRAQRETFNFALARLAHTQLAEMTKPGSTLDPEVQKGIKATAIRQARTMAVSDDGGVIPLGEIPVTGPFGQRTGYLTDDGSRFRVLLVGGSGTSKTDMAKAMLGAADAPLSVMIEVKKSDAEKIAMEFNDQGHRVYQLDLTPNPTKSRELVKVTPVESISDYFPKPGPPDHIGFDLIGNVDRFFGPVGFRFATQNGEHHFNAARKKAEAGKKNSETNLDYYRDPISGAVAASHVAATLDKIADIRSGAPDRPFWDHVDDYLSVMTGFEPTRPMLDRIAALEGTPESGMPERKNRSFMDGDYRGPVFEALMRDVIARNRNLLDDRAAAEMDTAVQQFRSIVVKTEKSNKGGDSIPQYMCREIRNGIKSGRPWMADPGGFVELAARIELRDLKRGIDQTGLTPDQLQARVQDSFAPSKYPPQVAAAMSKTLAPSPSSDLSDVREPGDGATVRKLRAANATLVIAVEGETEASINYNEQLFMSVFKRQFTELKDQEVECGSKLEGQSFTLPAALEAYRETGGLPTKASGMYFSGPDLWEARMAGARRFAPPLQIVSDNEAGTRYWKEDPKELETGYGIGQKGQVWIDSIPKGLTLEKMGIGTELAVDQVVIGAGNFHRDNVLVDLAGNATLEKGEHRVGKTLHRPALPKLSTEQVRGAVVPGGTVGKNGDTRWLPIDHDQKGRVRHVEYTTAVKSDKLSGRDTMKRMESHPASHDSVYVIKTISPPRPHPHTEFMPKYTADRTLAHVDIRPEDGRIEWPQPEPQLSKADEFALRGARRAMSKSAKQVAEAPTQLVNRNRHVENVMRAVQRQREVKLSTVKGINRRKPDDSRDDVHQLTGGVERGHGRLDETPAVERPTHDVHMPFGRVVDRRHGAPGQRKDAVPDAVDQVPQHPEEVPQHPEMDGGIEGP
jgi:hypothetical protein